MTNSLLAISIGNTRTHIGVFIENKLEHAHVRDNASFEALTQQIQSAYRPLAGHERCQVLIASTVEPIAQRVGAVIGKMGVRAWRVEKDVPIPIGRQLDPEAIVGEDRLLNAAAAFDTLKSACVVVDAGTAVTVDFVDGTGTFHGGAIAPGARMMFAALAKGVWALPEVDDVEAPTEPIGHNTIEAMRSGVFYGLRGMVRELTEQFAQIAGAYSTVVATGGDSEWLFSDYDLVEHLVPDLTLMGMQVTAAGPSPDKGHNKHGK